MLRKTPYRHVPLLSAFWRNVKRRAQALMFRGNRVECPICDGRFSGWLQRSDVGDCPYCRSSTRQKLLFAHLEPLIAAASRPLDTLFLAPDWGLRQRLAAEASVRLVTADLAQPDVDLHLDITRIELSDESFDLILCSHVMEHVPDDASAFAEFHRILRPGGRLFVQVPLDIDAATTREDPSIADPAERERLFGQFDHIRVYGWDLAKRLAQPGFSVRVHKTSEQFRPEELYRFGLFEDHLFNCEKVRSDSAPDGLSEKNRLSSRKSVASTLR